MLVYKYRSLDHFDRIYDIIVNRNLYCSKYSELNDPFEGEYNHYFGDSTASVAECGDCECGSNGNHQRFIPDDFIRICSLSTCYNDVKMWSFYADGHKGICIEIDLEGYSDQDLVPVQYEQEEKQVTHDQPNPRTIKKVLSRKSYHWEYEKEIRLFSKDIKHPYSGKINQIILGYRTSELHEKMIKSIAPNIKIKKAKIDLTYRIVID